MSTMSEDLTAVICGACSDRGVIRVGTWPDERFGSLCDECLDDYYDPISGTEYSVGECENCLKPSTKLLLDRVHLGGGNYDTARLCEGCRNPFPFS